jgi:hypothetical protein
MLCASCGECVLRKIPFQAELPQWEREPADNLVRAYHFYMHWKKNLGLDPNQWNTAFQTAVQEYVLQKSIISRLLGKLKLIPQWRGIFFSRAGVLAARLLPMHYFH